MFRKSDSYIWDNLYDTGLISQYWYRWCPKCMNRLVSNYWLPCNPPAWEEDKLNSTFISSFVNTKWCVYLKGHRSRNMGWTEAVFNFNQLSQWVNLGAKTSQPKAFIQVCLSYNYNRMCGIIYNGHFLSCNIDIPTRGLETEVISYDDPSFAFTIY